MVENTTTAQMEVAPQLTQKLLVDGLTTRLRQITKGKHGKNNQSSILDFPKLTQKCGIVFVTFTLQQKHSPAAVGPEGRKQVSFKGRRGSHRFFPSCALGDRKALFFPSSKLCKGTSTCAIPLRYNLLMGGWGGVHETVRECSDWKR